MLRIVSARHLAAIGTLGFLGLSGSARAIGKQPSGPPRAVRLIHAGQSSFEKALDVDFPGVRNLEEFETIKPFLVVIQNVSGHGIKAYTIRWVILDAKRRTIVREMSPWVVGTPSTLTGGAIIWKRGEVRLLSPKSNWSTSPLEIRLIPKSLPAAAKYLAATIGPVLSVDISVDAIVFDDGVFQGPDAGGLFDRYQCEQSGQHDEGAIALSLLDLKLSDDELVAKLNADVEKGLPEVGRTDRASLQDVAQAMKARELLRVFENRGRSQLKVTSLHLVNYRRTALRRE